jgi:trimeric autotransporter adhesin
MRFNARMIGLVVACLAPLFAQDSPKATAPASVPRLVRFTGAFHAANNLPVGPIESVTFSIYRDEQGGDPLWHEIQNVSLDADGRYSAMLGSTQIDGVPVELFSATESRWLGVQFNRPGEGEQPRVQLVSVPYALKASDAETLGGKPASAYLLDPKALAPGTTANVPSTPASLLDLALRRPTPIPFSGNMNYIPYFTDNVGSLGNSLLYQSSSGKVGIGTTAPSAPLHIAISGGGNVYAGDYGCGAYGGIGFSSNMANCTNYSLLGEGINTYLNRPGGGTLYFRENNYSTQMVIIPGGNVGIGTTTPGSKLDVAGGQINSAGGYCINGTNCITAWPSGSGGGTVTSVAAGAGLSGGTITTAGTISLNLGNANAWSGAQTFGAGANLPGGVWNSTGNVGIGTATPGSKLDVGGDINFSGNLRFQGNRVLGVDNTLHTTFLGAGALTANTTGFRNTASGANALQNNTTGNENTATGAGALSSNTTGIENTASGSQALVNNTTGSGNTASGFLALTGNTTGSSNTASGSLAMQANTTGVNNTATGIGALRFNTTGSNNTASGFAALQNNTGDNNIAIGANAAVNVSGSSNNIHIGSLGSAIDSGTIRIGTPGTQGSFFAAGIRGVTPANNDAIPVVIDSSGQLGTGPAPSGSGTVTSVTAGTGLSGGTITTAGTISLNLGNANVWSGAQTFGGGANFPGGIYSSGSVGIGTTNPGSKLDVTGDINFTGSILYQGSPLVYVPNIGNTGPNPTNIGIGQFALAALPSASGSENTASGYAALRSLIRGYRNTANGAHALESNMGGGQNTASGAGALQNNQGVGNTALGESALSNNTTGNNNIGIGVGAASSVSGGNSYNIHIGHSGFSADSGTIRIGTPGGQTSFFAAGVRGVTTANNDAIPVVIDSSGQLGTVSTAPSGSGTVTSVAAGAGLSGGTITTAGTISLNLGNANAWSGAQTFGAGANFPSGVWNSTGNVGIGTATPGSQLDVAGDINFTGSIRYQGSPVVQVSSGESNTAIGFSAFQNNTSGNSNTATGFRALLNNTIGSENTASGISALSRNTSGMKNTASGSVALSSNTTGTANTASGAVALGANITGSNNTAIGFNALGDNTTGNNNIAIGANASVVSSGSSNNIHIGSSGSAADSGAIRIGTPGTQTSFFAAGVRGVTPTNNDALSVVIDSAGQLGTVATAPSGSGTVTSVTAGAGLSGGTITTAGTISLNLGNGNVWSGAQTFGGGAGFPGGAWNTSGNVGIGTATPGSKLDVAGGQINSAGGYCINGANCITAWPSGGGTVTSVTAGAGLSGGTITTAGTISLNLGNANTWSGAQTFGGGANFPSGVWNSTGNVEIGTATPGSQLDVAGDINFTGSIRYQGSPLVQVSGIGNTATGINALMNNITGYENTAVGNVALSSNTTGYYNTATGDNTLKSNTTGHDNTAIGRLALPAVATGSNNIAIGSSAAFNLAAGSGNIYIGTRGPGIEDNTIRIGGSATFSDQAIQTKFFAYGVRGITTANNDAVPVLIDSAGQLGTVSSSRRFKEDIQDMGGVSRGLMRLRPVTFRYQKPFADGSKPIQYGLIAEEVAEVYPDLVAHSADGQIETVKYQVLDAMLLNEVQRQQRMIEQQQETIEQQRHEIEALKAQLKGVSVLESRLVALENAVAGSR